MAFLTTFHGLIDDLTTGGTQKALSAEQGKNLHDSKANRLLSPNGVFDTATVNNLLNLGFDFSNAYLENIDLNNRYFPSVILANADLAGSNFINANFVDANFINANLAGASLCWGFFTGVDLSSANLSSADLSVSDLSSADLSSADLSSADLSSAYLSDATLDGANLFGATGLNPDINIALASINKNPDVSGNPWSLTWIDGLTYTCNPATGLFTHA